jgi:hypothetical protein
MEEKGFHGASLAVDPESLVTPWLVTCWLVAVVRGLGRGHGVLRRLYDLDGIRTLGRAHGWQEAAGYFAVFGLEPKMQWRSLSMDLLRRYSRGHGLISLRDTFSIPWLCPFMIFLS